jgi:Predicted membrane protein
VETGHEQEATPADVVRLAKAGHLNRAGLERAYSLVGKLPDRSSWERFFDRALLLLGSLFCLVGLIFLAAYNWNDIPGLLKIALVALLLCILTIAALQRGLDSMLGRLLLGCAAVVIGVLFAVYGQVYQTGADSYLLFLSWMLFVIPWACVARWSPLWMLVMLLANVSCCFWLAQVISPSVDIPFSFYLLCLGVINILCFFVADLLAESGFSWLRAYRFPSLLFGVGLFCFTLLMIRWFDFPLSEAPQLYSQRGSRLVLEEHGISLIGTLAYLGLLVFGFYYGREQRNLFMLSLAILSIIAVSTGFSFARLERIAVVASIVVILAESAFAISWLRKTVSSWEQALI